MKANELMIGDWVYVNGTPAKVLEIRPIPDEHIAFFEEGILADWPYVVYTGKPSPIPLTAEILEKNGFIKDYNKWHLVSKNIHQPYEIHLEDERHFFYCEIRTYDAFIQIKICDVHELQHALRLCGLNDLADNFKVKEE